MCAVVVIVLVDDDVVVDVVVDIVVDVVVAVVFVVVVKLEKHYYRKPFALLSTTPILPFHIFMHSAYV